MAHQHPAARILAALAILAVAMTVSPAAVFAAVDPTDVSLVESSLQSAGLPIGNVVVHSVPNQKGVVYFIPQEHQNPGSSSSDPANNGAVVAQNQISQIANYLTQDDGVNFAMVEGDVYGPIPQDGMTILSNEISTSAALASSSQDLYNACKQDPQSQSTCSKVLQEAQSLVQSTQRHDILQGGVKYDKAQGASFTLYGGEDQSLLDQGATIVRDSVYLQDRLSQLQGNGQSSQTVGGPMMAPASGAQAQGGSSLLTVLASLMQGQQSQGVSQQDIASLEQSSNSTVDSAAQDLSKEADAVNSANQAFLTASAQHAQNLPTRQNNPYSNITSVSQIQQLIQQNNQQIQSTIVDQRNQAAAQNFLKGLGATNEQAGILVFGSGHTQGLIQDLNQEGLTVVDIIPQALGTSEQALDAAAQPNSQPTAGGPNVSSNPLLQMLGAQGGNPMGGGASMLGSSPLLQMLVGGQGGMSGMGSPMGMGGQSPMGMGGMGQGSPMMGGMGGGMPPQMQMGGGMPQMMGGSPMGIMDQGSPMMGNPMLGGSMGPQMMGGNPMMGGMPGMGGMGGYPQSMGGQQMGNPMNMGGGYGAPYHSAMQSAGGIRHNRLIQISNL